MMEHSKEMRLPYLPHLLAVSVVTAESYSNASMFLTTSTLLTSVEG